MVDDFYEQLIVTLSDGRKFEIPSKEQYIHRYGQHLFKRSLKTRAIKGYVGTFKSESGPNQTPIEIFISLQIIENDLKIALNFKNPYERIYENMICL